MTARSLVICTISWSQNARGTCFSAWQTFCKSVFMHAPHLRGGEVHRSSFGHGHAQMGIGLMASSIFCSWNRTAGNGESPRAPCRLARARFPRSTGATAMATPHNIAATKSPNDRILSPPHTRARSPQPRPPTALGLFVQNDRTLSPPTIPPPSHTLPLPPSLPPPRTRTVPSSSCLEI